MLLFSLVKKKFEIIEYQEHTKASEKYVLVNLFYNNKKFLKLIPVYYKQTALFLENEEEIKKYLIKIHNELDPKKRRDWEIEQENFWLQKKGAVVTIPVFNSLKESKFTCNRCSMPSNPNLQRRVQDIKDFGYTISTTKQECKKCNKKTTHHQLIYLSRAGDGKSRYETISSKLKKRILSILGNYDAFENNHHSKGLLPDHKFPEIRWDKDTKDNNDNLTDDQIVKKFQLLTNHRNLQKREVCRKCFQTNKRGKIFGINYYYMGDEKWNTEHKTGKLAEKGCEGCGWYDISKWRSLLNENTF